MIREIEEIRNKDKVAIVVVGYNRMDGLSRLLTSINEAVFDEESIPLVISIDASGNQTLYDYVLDYSWNHGPKFVNIQHERLGLKKHIFQCMSLTRFFKGVIILEDDLFVSPYFYHYATKVLEQYGDEEKVAGIALYKNEYNGFNGLPIQILNKGYDVFAVQSVCSWGELFNERMWKDFSLWMEGFDEDFSDYDIISSIKEWKRAWSKYMYAYMVRTNSFFIYPEQSLTTNFNDAGGEHGGGSSLVQVSLLQGRKDYRFAPLSQLACYDVYWNNLDIYSWLGMSSNDLTIDFDGLRDKYYGRYILSSFSLPYKHVKGYKLAMTPWELNIKYGIEGNDIILYDRENNEPENAPHRNIPLSVINYYFSRYQQHITIHNIIVYYWQRVKRKIGL